MSIQLKGGTAASMSSLNPTLLARQPGVEVDTGRFKIGDGVTAWNSLPYSSGPPGPVMQSPLPGDDGEPGPAGLVFPTGQVRRESLDPTAKNWQFLGTATGATTTVGPVIWTGQYRQFIVKYFIAGYNGGTPVGRFLCAAGTPSTTALTNGSNLSENFAAPTAAASIPGIPLAVTLTSISRAGWIYVDGASGSLKSINVVGQNGNLAVGTPPTIFNAAGAFSDLGTNLLLQQMQLTVYDTLIAVAASAQTFTAGTYVTVWGRNND